MTLRHHVHAALVNAKSGGVTCRDIGEFSAAGILAVIRELRQDGTDIVVKEKQRQGQDVYVLRRYLHGIPDLEAETAGPDRLFQPDPLSPYNTDAA